MFTVVASITVVISEILQLDIDTVVVRCVRIHTDYHDIFQSKSEFFCFLCRTGTAGEGQLEDFSVIPLWQNKEKDSLLVCNSRRLL